MSSDRFRSQGRYYQRGFNRHGHRTELIKVPASACGLIVGKGGRNVKELQKMQGISYVRVDFETATVKVTGDEKGISEVKHRVEKAIMIVTNPYFPKATLTCVMLDNYSEITFQPVSNLHNLVVRTEQLNECREYYSINSIDAGANKHLDAVTLAGQEKDESDFHDELVQGLDHSRCLYFFKGVLKSHLEVLSEALARPSISVNFGKTFVSSVPEDGQGRECTWAELLSIGYGREGLRPEFVGSFDVDKRKAILKSIEDEYEEDLSDGEFIIVYCRNKKTKESYKIKLRVPQGSNKDDADLDVETFQEVGQNLALCTILKSASQSEFRTTVATANDKPIDQDVMHQLQRAWGARSDEGGMKLRGATDDWLTIETVRHKKTVTLTNGAFILKIDDVEEDSFGKTWDGVYISLESHDINDTLEGLAGATDREAAVSRLAPYIIDLQNEALRISSMLDGK